MLLVLRNATVPSCSSGTADEGRAWAASCCFPGRALVSTAGRLNGPLGHTCLVVCPPRRAGRLFSGGREGIQAEQVQGPLCGITVPSGVYFAQSCMPALLPPRPTRAEWEEDGPGRRQKELAGQLFQALRPSAQFRAGWRGGPCARFHHGLSRAVRQGARTVPSLGWGGTGNVHLLRTESKPRRDSSASLALLVVRGIFLGLLICFCFGGIGVRCKERIMNERQEQTSATR